MSGTVTPFVDFNANNSVDNNENNPASIQPIADGEAVNATVSKRASENLRKRTEALRSRMLDSFYLENADRSLIIAGPGKVTWPGSTTALASGIPTLSDTLWLIPMLTPGFPQTPPVPPVASSYGVLHLQKQTGPANAVLVTSQRRSYAAGDQINITVTPGSVFSCTLDTEDAGTLRRTIKIVSAPATTCGDVVTALTALTPPAPDNGSPLVTAALEGGALSGDIFLDTQAKQYVSGNYDGEGHAITPANLASFFSGSPTEALAEGDTLCISYAMLYDTASSGGRRQSIPENTNTAVPAGSFFNSRVHPEKLVNALPICKVVNGSLVFATGLEVPAGGSQGLGFPDLLTLGLLHLSTAADSRMARLSTPYSGTHPVTLLWEVDKDSGGSAIATRVYAFPSTGDFAIVANASYDGSNWNKDTVNVAAQMTMFRYLGLEMYTRAEDANTAWTTGDWMPVAKWHNPRANNSTSNYKEPVLIAYDEAGNRRAVLDHNGFPAGRLNQHTQSWIGSIVSNAINGWSINVTGTGVTTIDYDSTTIRGPSVNLQVVANADAAFFESPYLFDCAIDTAPPNNMTHVVEFEVDSADLVGTPALSFWAGFIHDKGVFAEDYVMISKTAGNANWIFSANCVAGGVTTVNTGVAATGVQRIRIELHGKFTAGAGGQARAILYIDGTRAGIIDNPTKLPDSDPMPIAAYLLSTGVTNKAVRVSPIRYVANRMLSEDAL